jgi:hypothetical protein
MSFHFTAVFPVIDSIAEPIKETIEFVAKRFLCLSSKPETGFTNLRSPVFVEDQDGT